MGAPDASPQSAARMRAPHATAGWLIHAEEHTAQSTCPQRCSFLGLVQVNEGNIHFSMCTSTPQSPPLQINKQMFESRLPFR